MLIRLFRAIHRYRTRHYVSADNLAHIRRLEDTRGVELPTWRTPKELAQMRRQERRAALRVVNGREWRDGR